MQFLRRALKRQLDKLGPRVTSELVCERLELGSAYGSHTVCPEGLGPDSVVYSVGVGEDASFDVALIERFGLHVHAFDPTERSLAWVAGQTLPDTFHMNPVGLGTYDGTARFYTPKEPTHISHSVTAHDRVSDDFVDIPLRKLSTLMAERGHTSLDVLKIDIEGSEYDVIEQLCDENIPVRQLLIEFHHQLLPFPYARTRRAVQRLRARGFRVFHVSGTGREVSLVREG